MTGLLLSRGRVPVWEGRTPPGHRHREEGWLSHRVPSCRSTCFVLPRVAVNNPSLEVSGKLIKPGLAWGICKGNVTPGIVRTPLHNPTCGACPLLQWRTPFCSLVLLTSPQIEPRFRKSPQNTV